MNLLFLFKSAKTELKIVLATLAVITLMPLIAVVMIANTGVAAVSAALAFVDPVTHMVSVQDPSGNVIAQIEATTTWPARGNVTTEFGDPTPYQAHHTGTDIALAAGDPITPFMAGTIITVDNNPDNKTGYGKYVVIGHGNGITSLYGHMEETSATIGQQVKPGDVIGYEGATGHAIGAHLHFEVRVYDIPINPRVFLIGNPVK